MITVNLSFLHLQWGDEGKRIELLSNLEWAFEDHVTVKSDTTLATPFESLTNAQLQVYQTVEWDMANFFETELLLVVNSLKYDVLMKGNSNSCRDPSGSLRISAEMLHRCGRL